VTIASSLRQGLTESTRRFRVVLTLYLINLLVAGALAAPMLFLLDKSIGRSVAADGLESFFRFEVLVDLLHAHRPEIGTQFQSLGLGALLYALVSAVLSGGVIDSLKGPPRSPFLPRFLGGCGRLALRFLRLLPYLALALLALYWIGRGIDRLIVAAFDQSSHEVAAFWTMRGKQALMIALLLLLAAIFDLARILTALEDRAHMIGALLTSSGFVARHLGPILALCAALLVLSLMPFVPYLLLAQGVLPASAIASLFVLQQIVMLLRQWMRVTGVASLLAFYRGTTGGSVGETMEETRAGAEAVPGSAAAARLAGGAALVALLLLSPSGPVRSLAAAQPATRPPRATPPAAPPPAQPAGKAAAPLSHRVVSYSIQASLDPATRTVSGRESIAYRNDTRSAMTDLKLHLYPNAFSSTHSTYMQGIAWDDRITLARLERMRDEGSWGSMKIVSVKGADGADLTSAAAIDETVMTVPLPAPVRPGESARIEVAWETRLPRTFHRMGYWGQHYDVMQWFPKPAVFTDAGWKVYPFYRYSEFFADFGTFDVALTVPRGYLVEATGVPDAGRDNPDGTRTVTYRAADVHDFAWIADPKALVAREVVAEGPYSDAPVEVLYVHQPYRRGMAPRILAAARRGLLYYGQRFMPYPYPRLVIDDLPMGLGGGMEYPMLFTVSMAWFVPRLDTAPEEVTLHEFGHQYWYGIMATNEFEEPWLDEGINTYVTRRAMARMFGAGRRGRTVNALFAYGAARVLADGVQANLGCATLDLAQLLGFHDTPFRPVEGGLLGYPVSPFDLDLPGLEDGRFLSSKKAYGDAARDDPIATPSWGFHPGSYAAMVYDKTDVALETLGRLLGGEVLEDALRAYVRRYRFGHPTAQDFFGVLQETAAQARPGLDLRPAIEQIFRGSGTLDYAVASLRSREVSEPQGHLPPARAGEAPLDRTAPPAPDHRAARYETELMVRRLGEVALPVEVLVRFESGEEIRERWDGRPSWKRYTYEASSKPEAAIIDPERIYAIDLDVNNNSLTLERQEAPLLRLSLIWLFWIQNYLHLAASLS